MYLTVHLQKNGTSKDIITMFTGAGDITKFGLVDKVNGKSHLPHWKTEECNSLSGSDGSIFPPHITHNTTLYVFDKDLCRRLPLKLVPFSHPNLGKIFSCFVIYFNYAVFCS